MRRVLLLLAALLVALPAAAATGSWNVQNVGAGGSAVFSWTSASSTGDQPALDTRQCGFAMISAEVSGGPSVGLYLVPTATTATSSGTQIGGTITATARSGATPEAMGPYFIRPSIGAVGTGGSITIRCVGYARSGVGGGLSTWFGALSIVDQKMTTAVNQATYEWHHWSMKDDRPDALVDVATMNDWATFNAECITGSRAGTTVFVPDFGPADTCLSGPGGGSARGGVCRCMDLAGTGYHPDYPINDSQPHYWTAASTGGVGTGYTTYSTDAQGVAYPKPLARIDVPAAAECVSVEEVNHDVVFQTRDNPVFYVEATPWNYNAQIAVMEANLADMMVFIGWKRSVPAAASPGFSIYIDPAGSGVNALDEAALVDAIGFMWVDSKWYAVYVKNSVISSDLILDPVAQYGSLLAYGQRTGGSIAFLLQTDIDATYGGRKRGAYQVTPYGESVNAHTSFTGFPTGVLGSPRSGFPDVGGVGNHYHRVVTACLKTGSTQNKGRFFWTQMDVIK